MVFLPILGCGADSPAKPAHTPPGETSQRRHNYSAAWIYAIGEVDSLGPAECDKALNLLEGEINCSGQACRYARDTARDYLASCRKVHASGQVARIRELTPTFEARAAEPPVACTEKTTDWVAHGCGTDAACESAIQRWATRCANVVQSPLTIQILERIIENSLSEPRRVKIDVRGCGDFAKDLREVENCANLLDCENAVPKTAEYMLRCAEGKRHIVPLREALSIARVQLGAEAEFKPLALANQKVLLETLPGLLILSDNSGVVFQACGELASDLNSYLDLRKKCEKGDVVLLRAIPRSGGPELDRVKIAHESDEIYASAFPNLFVKGEAAERERRALDRFNHILASEATSDLLTWLSHINRAFAALPISQRRSDQVRQSFVQHDAELVTPLRELADAKLRLIRHHTSELELAAFIRRALKLPFSDVTTDGVTEWGAVCDLSEFALGDELKLAYAGYANKLLPVQQKAIKTKFTGTQGFAELLSAANQQGKACANAKQQNSEVVTAFDICTSGEKSCTTDEQKSLWRQFVSSRSQWRSARTREIILKVSAGSDDRPSGACSSL